MNDPAWRATQRPPTAALTGLALRLWELQGAGPATLEYEATRGDVSLIVSQAGRHSALERRDATAWRAFPEAWVMGLHEGHATVAGAGGAAHLCGVRLTPEGGHAVLGVAPAELASRIVALDEVIGAAPAAALVDRVRTARAAAQRFAILETFLRRRAAAGRGWDPVLRWAVEQTRLQAGAPTVSALAREIGWSRRRLHRAFVAQVGIAPKSFARVARFHAARVALDACPAARLADVAHAFGYADQAHLAREFRALAGVAPSTYLQRRPAAAPGFVRVDGVASHSFKPRHGARGMLAP